MIVVVNQRSIDCFSDIPGVLVPAFEHKADQKRQPQSQRPAKSTNADVFGLLLLATSNS
jgi:hypothetical protein